MSQINQIKKKIELIENKHHLLDWEVKRVKLWQAIRVQFYLLLLTKYFPEENGRKENNSFRNLVIRLKNATLFNPLFDFRKKDALVFESSRYVLIDDEYIDIYTKYFCDELETKGITFTKYQYSYSTDKLSKKKLNIKHLDFFLLTSKFFGKYFTTKIERVHLLKIKDLEKDIKDEFGVTLNLKEWLISELIIMKVQFFLYKILLNIKKPKKIYFVAYNGRAALIQAAKEKGIETIELQHGYFLSSEDIIWDYPINYKDKLEYFCDKFYQLSDSIFCTANLPLSEKNIILIKNKYLEEQNKKYAKEKKNSKQILIASQPYLSNKILSYILANSTELKDYKFIYKLHPNEHLHFFDKSVIQQIKNHDNIELAHKDANIFSLIAKSQYLITVFSSVAVEALYFKTKVLLLDLPGVEMMDVMFHKKYAIKVNYGDKLNNYLN